MKRSKSEGNPDGEVSESVNTTLSEQDEAVLAKIAKLPKELFSKCEKLVSKGTEAYRLQHESHKGNSVFFNQNGQDCRYNLVDGKTGSMYLAETPETALKEVFQNKKGLKESDLDEFYMGVVALDKDITVLQVDELIKHSRITVNDVTISTRSVTQELARKVRKAGFDGMKYRSNVTSEPCLVVWHNDPSGKGVATTRKQICLTTLDWNGRETADILVNDMGIPVEEG
ncbi:RES domain-containing protein [Enterobacter sp. BIGb0383]|uniref:RES family NAD+ phosphorylase n=1 Tax=unclassified Enterobacter TaxID=2608935 RepID=UPI000F4A13DA|nr:MULTISPECIES: RES family NAD+ phosphorylase [unclassified Enterobacter]ROP56351.1 RES domain-containing protein [Enterobacter sp. BIGb0383]ROS04417.1 RES domain-containing protein [Enterobacter sp. BIGb0359]